MPQKISVHLPECVCAENISGRTGTKQTGGLRGGRVHLGRERVWLLVVNIFFAAGRFVHHVQALSFIKFREAEESYVIHSIQNFLILEHWTKVKRL